MTIVHCKRSPYTHYIGRSGRGLVSIGLHNPFPVQVESNRLKVIAQFEAYARQSPVVMQLIKELPEDAVLGCWCTPKPCHGEVIMKLWKELEG